MQGAGAVSAAAARGAAMPAIAADGPGDADKTDKPDAQAPGPGDAATTGTAMTDTTPGPEKDAATAIWDQRYEGDEHVGTKPVIEGDPVDYTQHKFLYERGIARPQTGALDGYNLDRVGRQFLTQIGRAHV